MQVTVRGILLDIEGTTSSIDFVYSEMFPFVRRELAEFLDNHWLSTEVQSACHQIAQESALADGPVTAPAICRAVSDLMDTDAKTTGLKQLQGLIWKSGFESGELRAHLFDDVAPAMRTWHDAGVSIRIYSSGSVGAQKLFFGHTVAGNLLPLIDGNYDTTTGPKRDEASYRAIAADWDIDPRDILFASDVPAELDAARAAGLQTVVTVRPGNAPIESVCGHASVESFAQLTVHPTQTAKFGVR